MLKRFTMWAMICSTPLFTCASVWPANPTTDADTIDYAFPAQFLNEITVTAAPVINKTDRKVIRPDKATVRTTANGIDLLRKLHLPWISVNPMTDEISAAAEGSVILCINGAEATRAQITAIRPADVIRIEYHDTPGIRYAGAAAVIDYITAHHDSGGSISLDTFGAFAAGRYATIDHFAGQYNRDCSTWSVSIGYMGQQKDKWVRDYDEKWLYEGKTVYRHESGMPVEVGASGMESLANYNYLNSDGDMLDLRLGLDFSNVPNQEEGDRRTLLETSVSDRPVMVTEHTEKYSLRPNIGIYYLHKTSDRNSLSLNVQGSYLRSRMLHEYRENGIGENSRAKGSKYSLKVIGMYEVHAGNRVWNVGISNNNSFVRNVYDQELSSSAHADQFRTAAVAEYSDRLGNWGVSGNISAAWDRLQQPEHSLDRFFILPSANIAYHPSDEYFLKYAASLDYRMPSASEICEIEQPVQTGMIRRGNPDLKPSRIIRQSFVASYNSRFVRAEARIEYSHEHKPVMESVIFENNVFIRTFYNQRSFGMLTAGASMSVHPWKDHLSLTVEPVLSRYFSHGIDYRHCHNIFRLGLSIDFSYGKWLAYGTIMPGPANRMYGEEIIEESNMNQIMAGYNHGPWSIHAGVFNAFIHNYRMETRNLSALTPYYSAAHSSRSSSYAAVRINLAIDFGRKGRKTDIPADDGDHETGILTGTK